MIIIIMKTSNVKMTMEKGKEMEETYTDLTLMGKKSYTTILNNR